MQCSITGVTLKLMSTVSNPRRDQLHAIVDGLRDDLLPDAISALAHLEDDEPLSVEELANIEASAEDFKHGRVISLEGFKRQQGL
jgi:hypothetical protein